jgi:hypothetical protein
MIRESLSARGSMAEGVVEGPGFWWEKWIEISPVEILLRVDWQRRLLRSN